MVRSFIEACVNNPIKAMKNNRIYKNDMHNSMNHAIYYSKFDEPLFAVMDQTEARYNMKFNKPSLNNIEQYLYCPIRGNGWYSHAMVVSCKQRNKMITNEDI